MQINITTASRSAQYPTNLLVLHNATSRVQKKQQQKTSKVQTHQLNPWQHHKILIVATASKLPLLHTFFLFLREATADF